jgi:hypothetical protein
MTNRRQQAAGHGDGDADIAMFEAHDAVAGPDRIGVRYLAKRQRKRLDHEVVDRQPEGRLAVPAFHGTGIDVLAQSEEAIDLEHPLKDRNADRRLGLGPDAGRSYAHAVERHDLVRTIAVGLADCLLDGLRSGACLGSSGVCRLASSLSPPLVRPSLLPRPWR